MQLLLIFTGVLYTVPLDWLGVVPSVVYLMVAPVVEVLAETEGLKAHAQSVRTRCSGA